MLRLIGAAHPQAIDASVLFVGGKNTAVEEGLIRIGNIPYANESMLTGVRFLKKVQPDIIYGFGVRRIFWSIVARLFAASVAIGAERNGLPRKFDILSRRLDKYILHGYIANTEFTAAKLTNIVGVQSDRVHVAYNGMAFEKDNDSTIEKKPEWGSPTVICVANLLPKKGHLYLLRAIKMLRSQYPDLKALLVGKDCTDGQLFKDAADEDLADTYCSIGYQKNIPALLRACDVFALPSIAIEGMPTSVLEAMASGIPVLATDQGGTSELLTNNETGVLVPPASADSIAEGLDRILSSPQLRASLSANALNHVRTNHTVEAMVENHVRAFRAILDRKN